MKFNTEKSFTDRNRFTRMCIGEALIVLMQNNDFDKISVSNITKKAGISRMTYYKYYNSKTEVLNDYLNEIIAKYLNYCTSEEKIGLFHDETHILYTLSFFDKYADFFLTLTHSGHYSLIINAINNFMLTQVYPAYNYSIYELYFYAGALLNTYIKWVEGGRKESTEEMAHIIFSFSHHI